MRQVRWHILRDGERVTLTRRAPPQFDVMAMTVLPVVREVPLLHQIRQDIWRALQAVRGFSPVIEAVRMEDQLKIRAGGQVAGTVPRAHVEARIADVLEDPRHRARWIRCAS